MNNTSSEHRASRIVVAANEAVSLGVGVGAAIQCVSGRIWLTQEGDARDYVVPAGATFCADRSGQAVLTAIDGKSVVVFRETAPRGAVPGKVTVDSMERLTRAARAAQAEYVAQLFVRLGDWVVGAVRRLRGIGRQTQSSRSAASSARAAQTPFRGFVRSL